MTVSICVFCGTKKGNDDAFMQTAYELGKRLAQAEYRLVYGAGHIGMMGEVSKGALEHQSGDIPNILGIVPMKFIERENAGQRPHPVRTTSSLEERKTQMFYESDAFVALAGGMGTMDELFEVLTLSQTGGHRSVRLPAKEKPAFIVNTKGYFNGTIDQLDTMVKYGFLSPEDRALITVYDSIGELMIRLAELE